MMTNLPHTGHHRCELSVSIAFFHSRGGDGDGALCAMTTDLPPLTQKSCNASHCRTKTPVIITSTTNLRTTTGLLQVIHETLTQAMLKGEQKNSLVRVRLLDL